MAQGNSGQNALVEFRDELDRFSPQLALVMPPENVDRFKRIMITMLIERPDLLECSRRSLRQCAMRAAQDGLDLDGREAAVVVYKSKDGPIAQYIPMIAGLRRKVRQSGLVVDWSAHCVFEGDEFDYALGDRPYIHHKPSMKGGRRRPVLAAYSIATFRDGTLSRDVMNVDEIEDVRSKSRAQRGPWHDPIFYPEMCIKTVARHHSKQLPMSSDMIDLFARDDADNRDDDSGPPTPQIPPARRSVAQSLEEFGHGGPMLSPPAQPASEDQAGEQSSAPQARDALPGPDSDRSIGALDAATSPPDDEGERDQIDKTFDERGSISSPPDRKTFDSIKRAYVRGQQDRRAGRPDEVPNEYATNDRNREQIAWAAGYDGKTMPEWRTQ